jgi:hypothetical protein
MNARQYYMYNILAQLQVYTYYQYLECFDTKKPLRNCTCHTSKKISYWSQHNDDTKKLKQTKKQWRQVTGILFLPRFKVNYCDQSSSVFQRLTVRINFLNSLLKNIKTRYDSYTILFLSFKIKMCWTFIGMATQRTEKCYATALIQH